MTSKINKADRKTVVNKRGEYVDPVQQAAAKKRQIYHHPETGKICSKATFEEVTARLNPPKVSDHIVLPKDDVHINTRRYSPAPEERASVDYGLRSPKPAKLDPPKYEEPIEFRDDYMKVAKSGPSLFMYVFWVLLAVLAAIAIWYFYFGDSYVAHAKPIQEKAAVAAAATYTTQAATVKPQHRAYWN
jgi:hypothetical protein